MGLFKRNKEPDVGTAPAPAPLSGTPQPTSADGLVQDPLAGGAGMTAGFGDLGALGSISGLGGLFQQIQQAQQAAAAFQMGAEGMPMVDARNDPDLRAKLEQAIGHPLESGQMHTLDFSNDPQKAMAVMQVIQQHQLEKMGYGGAAATTPATAAPGNDAAAAGVMGVAAAATVGAIGAGAQPAQPADSDDTLSKLERLAKLRESGALTEDEFEHEKKRLLGEI